MIEVDAAKAHLARRGFPLVEIAIALDSLGDAMAAHQCGWADVRQAGPQWPPLEHFQEILERLSDPDVSDVVRFCRFLAAAVGFAVGFAEAAMGLRRRWSRSEALWGLLSMAGRSSARASKHPEIPLILSSVVYAFLISEGAGAAAGAMAPGIVALFVGVHRFTDRVKARLRTRVESEWVLDFGYSLGSILRPRHDPLL